MIALPTMAERVQILGAKFLIRAHALPPDALLAQLRPRLRDQRHLWRKLLTKNELWSRLPTPPEDADKRTLNIAIHNLRTAHLEQLRNDQHAGVLISAARPTLGLDPILWLPMSTRERSRLLRWRMGWLPGKPTLCKCERSRTSRHHLISCLQAATVLQVPATAQPNPIDYVLNQLPRRPPRSQRIKDFWTIRWPRLMDLMADIDNYCHPALVNWPEDEDIGQQFLTWLDPPPPTALTSSLPLATPSASL